MPVVLPHTLTNGQPNDADEVQDNLEALADKFDGNIAIADLSATVLNNFLKLDSVGDRHVSFGQDIFPGFAAVNDEQAKTVAHGLGAVPVFATAILLDTNTFVVCRVTALDAANIQVDGRIIDNAIAYPIAPAFFWLAIA